MKNEQFTNRVALHEAQNALSKHEGPFLEVFEHGQLTLELYKPDKVDFQTPHDRDEVYIISSGHAQFFLDGELTMVNTGDFLFVEAGREHRFIDFSDNFSTWVIFYGPIGGEKSDIKNLLI